MTLVTKERDWQEGSWKRTNRRCKAVETEGNRIDKGISHLCVGQNTSHAFCFLCNIVLGKPHKGDRTVLCSSISNLRTNRQERKIHESENNTFPNMSKVNSHKRTEVFLLCKLVNLQFLYRVTPRHQECDYHSGLHIELCPNKFHIIQTKQIHLLVSKFHFVFELL